MRMTFGALAFALMSATVQAGTIDTASTLYSNTLTVRDQGTGSVGTLQLNNDHTYRAVVTQNGEPMVVSGAWAMQADGSTVCLTPTSIGAQPSSLTAGCVALAGHNVGDRWFPSNDQRQLLDISLMQGR